MGQCYSRELNSLLRDENAFGQTLPISCRPILHRRYGALPYRGALCQSVSRLAYHRDYEMQILPQVNIQKGAR